MTHVICIALSDEEYEEIKKKVAEINMTFEEAVKFIVSEGLLRLKELHYVVLRMRAVRDVYEKYLSEKESRGEKNG
jgi:uncharacterized membrane protein